MNDEIIKQTSTELNIGENQIRYRRYKKIVRYLFSRNARIRTKRNCETIYAFIAFKIWVRSWVVFEIKLWYSNARILEIYSRYYSRNKSNLVFNLSFAIKRIPNFLSTSSSLDAKSQLFIRFLNNSISDSYISYLSGLLRISFICLAKSS